MGKNLSVGSAVTWRREHTILTDLGLTASPRARGLGFRVT